MMNIPITQSFWQKGGFGGNNIWGSGTNAAPFDQRVIFFYFIYILLYLLSVIYFEIMQIKISHV